jgi:hypothetical protein
MRNIAAKYTFTKFSDGSVAVCLADTGRSVVLTTEEFKVLELLDGTVDLKLIDQRLAAPGTQAVIAKLVSLRLLPSSRMPSRSPGLLGEQVGDEMVIYSSGRQQAYCLNPVAAFIYLRCDGESAVSEVARALAEHMPLEDPDLALALALAELREQGLLVAETVVSHVPGATRRSFLKTAVAAAAVAVVALPTPARAATICVGGSADCANNIESYCGQLCNPCVDTNLICTRISVTMTDSVVDTTSFGGCRNTVSGSFTGFEMDCMAQCGVAGSRSYYCCDNPPIEGGVGTNCEYCPGFPSPNLCIASDCVDDGNGSFVCQ